MDRKKVSINEMDKIKSAVNTYPLKLYNIHLARFISPFDLYPHSLKHNLKPQKQQSVQYLQGLLKHFPERF